MEMDGEQNSESSSAAGGASRGFESSAAKPLQLEATASPAAQDEAAKIGFLTTRISDEGQTRAAQLVESSGEPEKISSAGAINGDDQATNPSVAANEVDPLRDALAALDRRDYATAQRLFATCGRKDAAAAIEGAWAALDRRDYATAQRLFESLSQANVSGPRARESVPVISQAPEVAASETGSKVASNSDARQSLAPSPIDGVPFVDSASRRPLSHLENGAPRRQRSLLLGSGLLIFATCGAYAIYGSPRSWSFAAAKSQAMADLASAINVFKAPLMAITRPAERDEERSAIQAVSASLTQLTIHLDQFERDYGARLDKFGERIDQDFFCKICRRRGEARQTGAKSRVTGYPRR